MTDWVGRTAASIDSGLFKPLKIISAQLLMTTIH